MKDESAALYYIFASNGGKAHLFVTTLSMEKPRDDDNNLQVTITDISTSFVMNIQPAYLYQLHLIFYPVFGKLINVTLIGK